MADLTAVICLKRQRSGVFLLLPSGFLSSCVVVVFTGKNSVVSFLSRVSGPALHHFGFQASPSSFTNVKSICVAVMEADKVNVKDKSQTLNARVPNDNLQHEQQYSSNFILLTCKIRFSVSAFSGGGAVIVRRQRLAFKSCVLLYILTSIIHNLDNNMFHIWLFIVATRFSFVILI